ncbi:uncharacterized protein LOC141641011 [Silene latifolia]|uniref:uncharacterized protein LOC141641011 n=1 Tax=Silene latifolia TaxID=37657 RepID=UPI003D78A97D
MCRALRLTHLCFADDLLMFCRGDKHSICTILRAFATFSRASGLVVNREKSDIYFNVMSNEDRLYVMRVSGFREGTFPFRYLGIPISYKRMAARDCSRLVERVVMRIRGWGARKLSSAGRLVLVQSVLSQLLGKYVWWLALKADHLWIRYVNHMYIKDKNWLDYVPTSSSSWTWRKLCQVKEQFKPAYCNGQWRTNAGRYTISEGYSWLQGDQAKVSWHPVILNRFNVPKHSFIGCLAIQGRLMTKDRLVRFGVIQDSTCDMCLVQPEDQPHLLYHCRFSKQCWALLTDWLGIDMPGSGIIEWCTSRRCRSLMKKRIVNAAILALVYQLWMVRNVCRVDGFLPFPSAVVKNVQDLSQSRGQNWNWTSKYQCMSWFPWM